MNIHGSPTDQWFNSAIKEAKSGDIDRILEGSMAANLARNPPGLRRKWTANGRRPGW